MKIRVKGVLIELTKEQIDRIESELKDLEANTNTWIKLLTHFGFKKVNTKG